MLAGFFVSFEKTRQRLIWLLDIFLKQYAILMMNWHEEVIKETSIQLRFCTHGMHLAACARKNLLYQYKSVETPTSPRFDEVNAENWLAPGWHFTTLLHCVMRVDGRPAVGVQASGPLRVDTRNCPWPITRRQRQFLKLIV
ncbi:MAG: hypothetical protein WCA85_17470 [Paraburkholderia sp.]|uniref:hypothetical protein n=1 Tax=Paraburkholderia sp. TaxID=1926495 RepID=UPI003C32CE55